MGRDSGPNPDIARSQASDIDLRENSRVSEQHRLWVLDRVKRTPLYGSLVSPDDQRQLKLMGLIVSMPISYTRGRK
jgi:hypothetical protein